MNEKQKEMLSVLFDGESNDFEMRHILSILDEESRSKWQRYQWIRDAAKNKLSDANCSISVVDAVAGYVSEHPGISTESIPVKKYSWLKPVLGFATAASVAFITVLGVQQIGSESAPETAGFVANGNVSVSQMQISGGVGLNPVSASVSTASIAHEIGKIDAQKKLDEERMRYYMQQHAQHASFNNGRGILPMARMAEEEK